jgi:hypothetical protein
MSMGYLFSKGRREMASDEGGDPARKPVKHHVSLSAEAKATASADAIVLGGLPDLAPEQARAFYDRALQSLLRIRVRGFYGVVDGGLERGDDVSLFLYNDDKMSPVLNLTMSRNDLVVLADALNDLVDKRFRRG